jgi:hypothetical protein
MANTNKEFPEGSQTGQQVQGLDIIYKFFYLTSFFVLIYSSLNFSPIEGGRGLPSEKIEIFTNDISPLPIDNF